MARRAHAFARSDVKAEAMLREDIASFYDDPLGYVLYAFPWGAKGTRLERFPDGPEDWQRDELRALGAWVKSGCETAYRSATASGHGIGKSALVAWIIHWAMSTRPNLAGVTTANTASQLSTKTWRELSIWKALAINGHWFDWTATRFACVESPETWSVNATPWTKENSEAFAGLHADDVLVIYDEASAVADVIWDVSEGAMTTAGAMWIVFGNPTRNTGKFRECFGKFRNRWQTRQVDSRSCRITNKAEIEQWIKDYGEDSDFVRVRVRGVFPRAGSNQFISSEAVELAQARTIDPDVLALAPLVMGVDVARHGGDKSVILLRRGRAVVSITRFSIPDTMQFAAHVAASIQANHPAAVFVDATGMGWGVVDRLRQLNHQVVAVQAGEKAIAEDKYYNRRAELWGLMRDWLMDGASLPDDPELRDDLIGPEYGFDAKMRIQLEKKEDMKKRGLASPDSGDALAVSFDQIVGTLPTYTELPASDWRL
jgi:hypothetical protein